MKKKHLKTFNLFLVAIMLTAMLSPFPTQAAVENGWEVIDGNYYWYENGIKQGTEGRGKEIYDPDSEAWYWLDAVDGGKKATAKTLYQESDAGEWAENADGTGKWVRYDDEGHMVKGWYTDENGTYYFDHTYGTMAKGAVEINGSPCYFDEVTGIAADEAWVIIDGVEYWYEDGIRQGLEGRGKEIYDSGSEAWYWLDSVDNGKKAVSKDVYQESQADEAGNIGKWVRYDENGHMIKGWHTNEHGTCYFDQTYGTMIKGDKEIDGVTYTFDVDSGLVLSGHRVKDKNFNPTELQVYCDIMAMKTDYPEGMEWTNAPEFNYQCNAKIDGITYTGGGCVAFALRLSDAAFGKLKGYTHTDFSNIRVGDILRVNNNTHSVIVLEVRESSVIIAEGSYNNSVHWGRELSFSEIQETGSYVISRYPTEADQIAKEAYAEEVVRLINVKRTERGLNAVELKTDLCQTANECVEEVMELPMFFSSYCMVSNGKILKMAGYETPQSVVQYMETYLNLFGDYTGIGVVYRNTDTKYEDYWGIVLE